MAQKQMKSLAKDTAIYGISSIVGKFLNWLLVPLYTYVLESSSEYGIVTNLYAWTAFLLVILTYGMETGFFRFANKNKEEADKVYSTTLTSVGFTSLLFAICCVIFSRPIAGAMGYADHPEFITMLAIVVAMDAFGSIPFAYLRFKNYPIKFAALKLLMIFSNILFNIFFLVVCPWIASKNPQLIDWFYNPGYGVGYVFVSNLLSTTLVTLVLLAYVVKVKFDFDKDLLKKMLRYSLPLLVLGIAGIMNQTLDKIIFPFLFEDKAEASAQLGIYGACFKIAMVMMMFTQAFRYAYEPFIFAQHKEKDSTAAYADAMKYFIIFSFLIFLGMVFYLDIMKYIIRSDYWEGLRVVPIVLFSYIFQGVFFNLSLWYKLTDQTMYGAWFSILGCIITIVINVTFVPVYGYMASAWAAFACYFTMMVVSYYFGQKNMPINYDLKRIGIYTIAALALYALSFLVGADCNKLLYYGYRTILLGLFILLMLKLDLKDLIPSIKKQLSRR
jgi:O-antigen/teichoic acid export membrane protein